MHACVHVCIHHYKTNVHHSYYRNEVSVHSCVHVPKSTCMHTYIHTYIHVHTEEGTCTEHINTLMMRNFFYSFLRLFIKGTLRQNIR